MSLKYSTICYTNNISLGSLYYNKHFSYRKHNISVYKLYNKTLIKYNFFSLKAHKCMLQIHIHIVIFYDIESTEEL